MLKWSPLPPGNLLLVILAALDLECNFEPPDPCIIQIKLTCLLVNIIF